MKTLLIGLIVLAARLAAASVAGAPLEIGDRRQVFVDGRFLAVASGVALREHVPVKAGEVLLRPDHPEHTLVGAYVSVVHWNDGYHMWYDAFTSIGGPLSANGAADDEEKEFPAHRYLCYARSRDGITWEKPRLNLARAEPQVEPNIVLGLGSGGYEGSIGDNGSVEVHPRAPDGERLVMLLRRKEPGIDQLDLHVSADGIQWRLAHPRVMGYSSKKHHLDTQNVIFWDDRIGRYVIFARRGVDRTPGQARVRTVARAESDQLTRFPDVDQSPVVFQWDALDPDYVVPATGHRASKVDYYTNAVVKYPWAQDAYYMFPAAYFHYDGYLPEFAAEKPTNAGVLDVRFAASRDGISWERLGRRPFVRPGPAGDWDSRGLYMVRGIVPGSNERELFLYYRGSDQPHGWDRNPRNVRILRAAGLESPHNTSGMRRLVLRRDGFISARAGHAGGSFATPLVRFAGGELRLNVNTYAGGELRIELQDELGIPFPGHALADADMIHSTNETDRLVTWQGKSDVSALAGRPVRLHVTMRDVDLYAFQFRAPRRDDSK
jgi:hypothetical protein